MSKMLSLNDMLGSLLLMFLGVFLRNVGGWLLCQWIYIYIGLSHCLLGKEALNLCPCL